MTGVDVDGAGRVYMCHATRYPVLVFDRRGTYLETWGGMLHEPHAIRVSPDGSVWVVDKELHQVFKFSPHGEILGVWGERLVTGADSLHFDRPTDVAFGPSGDAYVSDGYGNSRVVHLSREGRYLGAWGRRGSNPGEFRLPHSVATDADGKVYVADRENRRIQIFTSEGQFITQWPLRDKPFGLDIAGSELFVVYEVPDTVQVYNLQGRLLTQWGKRSRGRKVGQLADPHMLCVDRQDRSVYTAELRGHRIQRWLRR
jgi:DNA-binding beta-propeller fold protein YncE